MILNYNCQRMQLIRINKKFNKSNPPKKLKKKKKNKKKRYPKGFNPEAPRPMPDP